MKKTVAIVGAGSAALVLAAHLDESLYEVHIYERNQAPGRKFLVAGDGGFNLTHAETKETFVTRYKPEEFMYQSFMSHDHLAFRSWLAQIGIPTYVGSSQRVFPEQHIKPIDVLNAVLRVLAQKDVQLHKQHIWKGWEGSSLAFEHQGQHLVKQADITVFALGGGSWKVTGSWGEWLPYFEGKGINAIPFVASNCAFGITWPTAELRGLEGQFLKNIAVLCERQYKKGELVLTHYGLEGGAIYALSNPIRAQMDKYGKALIGLDLKPMLTEVDVLQRLQQARRGSWTQHIEKQLNLSKVAIALLKAYVDKDTFSNPQLLAPKIKNLPLYIEKLGVVDEAISTVGGINLDEVDENFQLKKLPSHYCIGEMLDWDAPTGGYLLQACFSMGCALAKHLNEA